MRSAPRARTTQDNGRKRPLYATVGAADKAVEFVRESKTDLQARLVELRRSINDLERDPRQLRVRAVQAISGQADAVTREAQQRRAAIEARVAELQAAYDDLIGRGDALVRRIRRQQSTQET